MENDSDEEDIPLHIQTYMECLEKMAEWCKSRAKCGDVDIPTLANVFAKNIIKRCSH